MMDSTNLFRGDSLRVVLYPDPKRHGGPATVESMELRHIFVRDGMIIGVSAYEHAWHRPGATYDPTAACAYAYTDFCDLVFNCSVAVRILRGYHRNFYKNIRIVSVPNFQRVWTSDRPGEMTDLLEAIETGRAFKAAIEHPDGLWSFHPIHLPTARLDRNGFEIFTAQAAYPAVFRFPGAIKEISGTISGHLETLEREALKHTPYRAPDFDISSPDFASTYYILRSNGHYSCGQLLTDPPVFDKYRTLILYADGGGGNGPPP
jgi:hypothetical protein